MYPSGIGFLGSVGNSTDSYVVLIFLVVEKVFPPEKMFWRAPPPSAHFQLFGGEKKVHPLQTQRHNSSNNYIEMERRNDGNFLIT